MRQDKWKIVFFPHKSILIEKIDWVDRISRVRKITKAVKISQELLIKND